jgi:hypothetical protein
VRRRISSMLQRPDQHEEEALDVMAGATHEWIRFFALLRMTALTMPRFVVQFFFGKNYWPDCWEGTSARATTINLFGAGPT